METVEGSKVRKGKRKRELNGTLEEGGSSKSGKGIDHKHKRVHTSNPDMDIVMNVDQHKEMLDTVSGHIRELVTKDTHKSDVSESCKQTKARNKSKKTKTIGTKSSLREEEGEETNGPCHKMDVSYVQVAEEDASTASLRTSGVSQESALEYLRLWKEERDRWSFKKKTQYWLIQNMYDRTKVRI